MARKLGELLIEANLLTQAQLEEALQAQVIFGGKLGTILIEMGLISENVLAEALAKLLGFPCAKPGDLQKIPGDIISIVSQELAEKYKVIPMSVSGKKLTVAMENPNDLQAIDDLSFRTGYIILPVLAMEVRLAFALERYYAIKRTMRYIAPPKHVKSELDQIEREGGPAPEEKKEEEEFLGLPVDQQEDHASQKIAELPEKEVVEEPVEEEIEELEDDYVTLEDIALKLIDARDREHVADAMIEYLGTHYARAALFIVMGGQVTGWRSVRAGKPIAGFEEFQIPLAEASVLKTAVDSQSYFLGPIPQSGANLALTTFLGKPAPKAGLILPMTMLGRVVGLVYVDDPSIDLSEALVDIQKLTAKALMAFEILILHNKILRS